MFNDHERRLLRDAGLDYLLTQTPVEVHVSAGGGHHASDYCRVGWPPVPTEASLELLSDVVANCSCFAERDTLPLLTEVWAVQQLFLHLRELERYSGLVKRALAAPPGKGFRELVHDSAGSARMDLPWRVAQTVPRTLLERWEANRTRLQDLSAQLLREQGRTVAVQEVAASEVAGELLNAYHHRNLPIRRATRYLVQAWSQAALEGTSPDQRARMVHGLVGRVAADERADVRLVGTYAKMWLRDAERLLPQRVMEAQSAPRCLAVYGTRLRDSSLELEANVLRESGGQILVAVTVPVRRLLAQRGVVSVRCSEPVESDEVVEIAAALWEPSLQEQFNDLDALVQAARAVLA